MTRNPTLCTFISPFQGFELGTDVHARHYLSERHVLLLVPYDANNQLLILFSGITNHSNQEYPINKIETIIAEERDLSSDISVTPFDHNKENKSGRKGRTLKVDICMTLNLNIFLVRTRPRCRKKFIQQIVYL